MKKLFLLAALLALVTFLKAQPTAYKAFKFDIGLGYIIPTGGSTDQIKGGGTLNLQPHYRLPHDLALGFRFEGAALEYLNDLISSNSNKVNTVFSYCISAEYYLSKHGFRPFIGAGGGIFSQKTAQIDDAGNLTFIPGNSGAGFFPEIGFEAGYFRMSADYEVAGNNNNYFAF